MPGQPAPFQRRSKRLDGSATSGFDDRRNRATTVWPSRFVKLTKNRPVDPAFGGKARPSSPCSPPDRTDGVMFEEICPLDNAVAQDPDPAALLHNELNG